ncbi:MAG: 5-(carboxyamino)imidazole ribonucleotide synthase [Bacteroidetes bacterium]|nr:5-(carboxyamino)imidazole ribonucleotide synthase [Bacteroidota bacterium]
MEQLVTSDFKLGIIAGGQLGKMLALAASNWDLKTYILDPNENCPASTICTNYTKGDYNDYATVYEFGKKVDMITFDIENINTEALLQLKKEGKRIFPEPEILKLIQDKGLQKQFFQEHTIPSSAFQLFTSKDEILTAIEAGTLQLPFVQKLRTSGYDGKGVEVINSEVDLPRLMEGASLIEAKVKVKKELAVIVARNSKGEMKSFPMVEMEFNQEANLVERLICPSSEPLPIQEKAKALAEQIISNLQMTGILAVEFFLDESDQLYVNEVAPRTHNSGHHTIESCITSQYEQHLRSILGFALGSTEIKIPSVMINLLGEKNEYGKVKYEGLTESMAIEGIKIHIYGKKETTPYRKMGHVTILDKSIDAAKLKAKKVSETLKVKAWK